MDLHLTEREAKVLIEALLQYESDCNESAAFAHRMASDTGERVWGEEASAARKLRERIEEERAKL